MKKLLLFGTVLTLMSCRNVEVNRDEVVHQTKKEHTVSLVAVGDNLIHSTIYEAANTDGLYDFKPFYQDVKPFIQSHDLAFINQETILGGKELGLSSYPSFNSPHELGDAIIDAGFNLISIANNHTLDRGEQAIQNAITYLEQQDVVYAGATSEEKNEQVKIFEKNNIKFAFIAWTTLTNGITHPDGKQYLANVYSHEKAEETMRKVREKVDFVIVSMHWGSEYFNYPNQEQVDITTHLHNLKVDVILGHHPHVIQPIKLIDRDDHHTLVIYSLGNFLSDQVGIDRKIGQAFQMKFIKRADQNNEITREMSDLKSHLLYHYKTPEKKFRVLLFEDINANILPNYLGIQEEKTTLLRSYTEDLNVQ